MPLTVREGDIHLADLQTRMPFRYGIATMTRMPMAFVRVALDLDGRTVFGVAADLLPPKWFTKDPNRDPDLEVREMLAVIARTLEISIGVRGESPFEIWQELYETQDIWSETEDVPPLLAHFGTSLVERAVIDAWCRGMGDSFHRLLRADQTGLSLDSIHPELAGRTAADLLPRSPLRETTVRHTVGLADPLTQADLPSAERLDDGLPQTLEDCIRTYGLRHFKIKLCGDLTTDRPRLEAIEKILTASATDYQVSLDGNEQFKAFPAFRDYWDELNGIPAVQRLIERLLFVEQPVHRDHALDSGLLEWADRPAIIIDESDANVAAVPLALKLGYAGASHKNCKGVFRGIAAACLLENRKHREPGRTFIHSGEDLCNLGPVALQQDLAVAAALGITSVERNGHHYVAGLSWLAPEWQAPLIHSHGDLYRRSRDGWPTLDIRDGRIRLASVNESPFGLRPLPDPAAFTPAADWVWPPAEPC